MTEPHDDLTRAEREALARLPREARPPRDLEDATVAALAVRGLLRRSAPRLRRHPAEIGLALAASILLFLGGLALGRRGATEPAPTLPQYLLLLYEGPEYHPAPPGREAERVREYGAWAEARADRGELVAGEELAAEPDLVIGTDGRVTTVRSGAGQPKLTGFFVIRAADGGRALEIARSCPHVRYGGSIVIRPIQPT